MADHVLPYSGEPLAELAEGLPSDAESDSDSWIDEGGGDEDDWGYEDPENDGTYVVLSASVCLLVSFVVCVNLCLYERYSTCVSCRLVVSEGLKRRVNRCTLLEP